MMCFGLRPRKSDLLAALPVPRSLLTNVHINGEYRSTMALCCCYSQTPGPHIPSSLLDFEEMVSFVTTPAFSAPMHKRAFLRLNFRIKCMDVRSNEGSDTKLLRASFCRRLSVVTAQFPTHFKNLSFAQLHGLNKLLL